MSNCEDAYGFPPYTKIEHFLHSRNGNDLQDEGARDHRGGAVERALDPAPQRRHGLGERIPPIIDQITTAKIAEAALNGNGNGRHRGRFTRENVLGAAVEHVPLAPASGS